MRRKVTNTTKKLYWFYWLLLLLLLLLLVVMWLHKVNPLFVASGHDLLLVTGRQQLTPFPDFALCCCWFHWLPWSSNPDTNISVLQFTKIRSLESPFTQRLPSWLTRMGGCQCLQKCGHDVIRGRSKLHTDTDYMILFPCSMCVCVLEFMRCAGTLW